MGKKGEGAACREREDEGGGLMSLRPGDEGDGGSMDSCRWFLSAGGLHRSRVPLSQAVWSAPLLPAGAATSGRSRGQHGLPFTRSSTRRSPPPIEAQTGGVGRPLAITGAAGAAPVPRAPATLVRSTNRRSTRAPPKPWH